MFFALPGKYYSHTGERFFPGVGKTFPSLGNNSFFFVKKHFLFDFSQEHKPKTNNYDL